MPLSQPDLHPLRPDEQLARITVDEYERMTQSGILREGSPIELLDGLLVWKDRRDHEGSIMVVGTRHARTVTVLHRLIDRGCEGDGCQSRSQQPLRLTDVDMPEPDVMVLLEAADEYVDRHPGPADVRLVAEVADSSLKQDREDKLKKYAAAGIGEYWIVNLVQDQIEVYTNPRPAVGAYADCKTFHRGQAVSLQWPDAAEFVLQIDRILK